MKQIVFSRKEQLGKKYIIFLVLNYYYYQDNKQHIRVLHFLFGVIRNVRNNRFYKILKSRQHELVLFSCSVYSVFLYNTAIKN